MKLKIRVLLLFAFAMAAIASQAQYQPLLPRTLPSPNSKNYYKVGYVHSDSGFLFTSRDTSWRPKYPTVVYWKNTGVDSSLWLYDMSKWSKVGSGSSGGGGNLPVVWTQGFPTYDARYAFTSHTHTFASLTSKPTTLAGYGITDASPSGHTHAFSSLTGRPTTLSGYGITDAVPSSRTLTINGVALDLSLNRSWTISAEGTIDTTGTQPALVTNYQWDQKFNAKIASGILKFQVAEGIKVVQGVAGAQDTVIIDNLGVVTGKIANAAVTTQKLADAAVTTQNITDLHVTTPKIGNLAVTNSKIADGAVDDNKMATNQKIGSLPSLTTTDKSNVVAAINEVKASIGGGGSLAVQEEGSNVVTSATMNFVGPGVTASNVGGVATVTIPGGAGTSYRDLLKDTTIASGTGWNFFLGGYIGTYKTIEIKITNLQAAVSTDVLFMQLSSNGGSTFDGGTNNYRYTTQATLTGGSENIDAVSIVLAANFTNSAGDVTDLVVRIPHPNVATAKPTVFWNGYHPTATVVSTRLAVETLIGSARRDNAQITNAFRLFTNGGNMGYNLQIFGEK